MNRRAVENEPSTDAASFNGALSLRTYFNVFKFRMGMTFKTKRIYNHPFVAYIEPTSYCNLRCPACPTGLRSPARESAAIKIDRFCELIDRLSPYLMSLYFYNWGEPLLHRECSKMIRYAAQKGIKVFVSSNLSIPLSDERIHELVKSGLYSLKVGLDGVDQQSYEQYRREGKFDLVVSNIEKIVKFKRMENSSTPILSATYHVFKHNENSIDDARKLTERIGMDRFIVAPSFIPPEEDHAGIEAPSNPALTMFNHLKESFTRERTCSWLYGAVVHNPNGSISPCCGISHEEDDFGRWDKDEDIYAVMNNEQYTRARKIVKDNKDISFRTDDGMGFTQIQIDRSREVVCAKCPTPYQWGRIKSDLQIIVGALYGDFKRAGLGMKIYFALCYLLMGAPFFSQGVLRLLGKDKKALRG